MLMHSAGLSEDWQQIKKDSGLGVMEFWITGVMETELTCYLGKFIITPSLHCSNTPAGSKHLCS
jgi:hypothetical protein